MKECWFESLFDFWMVWLFVFLMSDVTMFYFLTLKHFLIYI